MANGKSYHEVMDVNAKSSPKGGKKVLRAIEHERSANGGHVFTHRFKNDGPNYHEPETHTFGKDEGAKAAAHFAKYAGITGDEEGDKEKGESTEHKQRAGIPAL